MKDNCLIAILVILFSSCSNNERNNDKLFTLLSPSGTNVKFVNTLTESEESNIIEYLYFNNGGGVAAGDINNDGLTDLYFSSSQAENKLYLNKGNMKFNDITDEAGVAGTGDWKTGVTMADVNGDGLLDIYLCEVGNYKSFHGRNQLFINMGNLTFNEEAHEYGLDFQGFSTQAAFFDYDLDGDLDMYLLNHSVHTTRSYGDASLRLEEDSLAGDILFRNDVIDGKHVFRKINTEAGVFGSQIGYGLGVNISDINNDGFPDIYISNDFHEDDYMYINNGNGTFTDRLAEGIAHTSRSSMGDDIGDINNDGLLDIIVLDMLPDEDKIRKQSGGEDDYELYMLKRQYGYNDQFVRNTLQLNLGDGLFSEIGFLAGVYSTDWSWSPLFCDLDNDGWKDLFITNGIYRRANDLDYVKFLTERYRYLSPDENKNTPDRLLYEKMPLHPNVNYLFKNNGNLTFSNMAFKWGLDVKSYSNGSTYADLDNDGDLDLVVNNINDNAFIARNNSSDVSTNHFLSFIFKGKGLNPRAIGARVTLYYNNQIHVSEQFPSRGFLSSTADVLNFGTGEVTNIDSLVVRWPDLSEQTIRNVPADQFITLDIRNASGKEKNPDNNLKNTKLFTPGKIQGLEFKHEEDDYTDFHREHLIPHSLSSEGPPLAVADINGDGLQDIFIGGAKWQKPALFIQQKNGTFSMSDDPVFSKPNLTDDTGAIFFDADGDGDYDLYIVRGGDEIPAGNLLLYDLLLVNDGKGRFKVCDKDAMPGMSHNGSCVRPCDFDKDGDTDLFVGSRSVPGNYGLSPYQYLLENDGRGHFKNVTDKISTGLKNAGMVTDACWIDYDRDGDYDLILVGEWMNISLFENSGGRFSEITASAGLDETEGWWNCIYPADIDKDGDTDFIAGNLGLNSIIKASPLEPVEMYLNDFDNNGSVDQVICAYMNGKSYPVASLDEMSAQIKGLSKKITRYSDYGGRSAQDIFGATAIKQSIKKKAVLFESCIFLNQGDGTFKIIKLPCEAQFSTVRDILVEDFNRDGWNDILIAGNNYSVRPSYGRYDASYGWLLLGDSTYSYRTLMPAESGLIIKGATRRLAALKVTDKNYLLAAMNNEALLIFRLLK
jgi:hypothetical protein